MAMKCPSCNQVFVELRLEPCVAAINPTSKFKAVAFCCPMCSAVLGSQIDPRAIKAETIAEIDEMLKGKGIATNDSVDALLRRALKH